MQCRKGPNAVRTGHTAAFASLDLRKTGAKTAGPGPKAQGGEVTEQVHGTYAKTADQRLSYCRWFWLLPRTPQMPKRGVLAFGITPNTQHHTNCNTRTHCRHHVAQCYPLLGTTRPSSTQIPRSDRPSGPRGPPRLCQPGRPLGLVVGSRWEYSYYI
jgi:hypothetical protein